MSQLDISQISFNDKKWSELVSKNQTATFFQTPAWLSLWAAHFVKDKEDIKILAVFDKDELIGVAPFLVHKGKVSFLGTTPVLSGELVSDFGDIVAKSSYEEIVWQEVLSKLSPGRSRFATPSRWPNGLLEGEHWKIIELYFIREDSPSFAILKKLAGKAEKVDVAPYLDLPSSWDDYLASLDRKKRHELRRKIRRLESEGAFKVSHEGEPVDIDEFFRLVSLSSEQKRNFLSPKMKRFFEDAFNQFFPQQMACLCFMKLNDKNIAASMLFIFRDELLLYNSGFDPEFAYLSPGFLLKAFIIKHAIEEGKKRFDFLRGGERYKYDLGGKERKVYKISFESSLVKSLFR